MEQRRYERRHRTGCLTGYVVAVLLWCVASAQLRYSISEGVNEGTVVGNIAKDLGLEKSTLKDRKYRIVSGGADSLFHVNQNDGILYVSREIDREEVCAQSSTCLINLKTVLENPLEVHYVVVEVLDVNDHSPSFPEKEKKLEISESVLPGARFQLKPSRDRDSGHFSVQQYKLSHNDHFRLEVRDKGEDGKIPILVLQKSLDREAAGSHSLVLTALDGGKPPKSGDMNILVNVLDVNDNTPIFSKDIYSVTLSENAPVGTTVIQVNATDLDDGPNGEVVYSFGNSVSNSLFTLFDINQSTGEIIVNGLIDYEEKDKYEIEIQASDKGVAPLTTEKSVIIKIVDVNDNAPEIEVTSFSSSIPEDSRPGTTVALISVNDLDSGLNGNVICSIAEDVPFVLSPSLQDKMYSLVTKLPLDREKRAKYELTIVAKDSGQPSLSSEKTISVVVSDVNDNSPEFSLSPYTFYVSETNEPGTSVFAVKAFDRDENDNAVISYRILRDGSEENKLTSFLNINTENGDILALKSFDFETLKTFQFQVVATDSGTPSLSSNVTVNVFILDQNDNAPVILYPVSSNGSAEGVEEIPRNVNAGHLVTKVRAYDADIGYNGWLLFSLQQVTDHSLFGLDRYTGQIRTLRSFTETDEAEHKLVILVKDNGNVSLSATATVIVKLVEPKEAFAASDVKSSTKVDEEDNVTLYLMITLGSVSTLFLISIIVLIAMQCSKPTDYTSKYLQDTNYDGTLCHSIQYRSGDKRYMLVGPRMSIGSTIVPGSHANTLVLPDRRRASEEVRQFFCENPNDGILYVSRKIDREEICERSSTCLINLKTVIENPLEVHYVGVEVLDINDHSPSFPEKKKTLEISESVLPGVRVPLKASRDPDSGPFSVQQYKLSPNDHFRLEVKDKGEDDSGTPSLSSNVTVNVFILDQNDNAPVILYPVSSNGSAEGVEEIPRNVNAGHLVTKVRAYDADIGYNGWLLFSLQEVTDHSLFGLDRYTGQIRTLRSFTETDEAEHKLVILVKDNGNVSLSATATVIVKLVEPREAFAASDVKSESKVDKEDNCSKTTDYTSKYLQETNYDGTLCHSIQYRSGDKRYMLVGPRMSIGSTIVPGSHANTLVLPDRRRASGEEKCRCPWY
ncbi:protocadherin beta-15-like [Thunnus maccoyii]|uniref:protocadherin beta-15-like n=1 Tax=Thunnus maccoyii TaxID=8240 RepID=UPI001C4BDBD9|nr:protocadherin beta-15-like [Thunnus maccoyii]